MAVLQSITVPLLAVNDTSLTVIEINYANKDFVAKGAIVMVFETSKTTYEVVAEVDGYIKLLCTVDHDYNVNEVVAELYETVAEIATIAAVVPKETVVPNSQMTKATGPKINYEGTVMFSQKAQALMSEKGIDPNSFVGLEMVTSKDVLSLVNPGEKTVVIPTAAQTTTVEKKIVLPEFTTGSKITKIKKFEIEFLKDVQQTGLTSTIAVNFDVNGVLGSINDHLKYFKNSLLPVIMYESGRLLEQFPLLNAFFYNDEIYTYDNINIGFAIDIDKGLKVLNVKDCNKKSLVQIENEILELSGLYVEDKIPLDKLTDISFTITDLSNEGVSYFKPLVNKFNSAIMGVSAIDEQLQRCNVCITFDHRVTEGKYVAQFLNELKIRIESYAFKANAANAHLNCYKCLKNINEDLSNLGLLPIVTTSGKQAYICQTCWNGI